MDINLSDEKTIALIQKSGKVSELFISHEKSNINDKKIIIKHGGRILDVKHYLSGIKSVVVNKLDIKTNEELKNYESNLKSKDSKDSLNVLYELSKKIHSHTISADNKKIIEKITNEMKNKEILIGIDINEEEVWKIIEDDESNNKSSKK